ncbi:hypothetical protein [Bacillus thuringiensis]|uniref:hypothetical protein n=1 Tax=Bacillus thuringiensis TaxID=1428 RepID=UPI000BF2CD9F|nr:hypothetical protein [Bacillus thuringiensis]PFR44924.1 hypothetical protein COK27_02825 [Bacillus thuringiensis]PGL22674.1 hypothetical protein CN921_20205 [Bacillus thuringiensis]
MKRINNIVLILIVFVSLMGCNSGKSNSSPTSKNSDGNTSNQDLVGTDFKMGPKGDINSSKRLFKTNDGKFTSTVNITSKFQENVTYRLIVLLDYEKAEFKIEGESEKKAHADVSISANQEKTFNIELTDIKQGLHDVIAVLIREPNKFLTEDRYIPSDQFYVFQRFQIKYGNEGVIKNLDFSEVETSKGNDLVESQVFITKNKDFKPDDVLNIINKKDIANDYWLHLYGKKNEGFVIIPMIDYDIHTDITKGVFFKSNVESEVSLKLNFNDIDLSKKKNQVNILLIRNPYINLEDENGGIAHPELQFLEGLNRFQFQ